MSNERKVQEVLARYVRATDARDGRAQGALFTDDAVVQIRTKNGQGVYEPFGEPLIGGAAVQHAVENFMEPHPAGGSSHHTTSDHIIEVDGDTAHLNAQFIVFRVRARLRPETGWPVDAFGAQGTVEPIESGYYDTHLRRVGGEWKIVRHEVLMDMPMAVPGV
ncbi:nuclear transport factor 2 family protein [Streptomyces flaveolus]|uniref:nuclear transport factor 2 family protein n=1 Tax=Streptomyces flaveolus TaxID=67297 RepID=UPI0034437243